MPGSATPGRARSAAASRSLVQVDLVVGVVHERHHHLVPAWEVLREAHDDQVGQPRHVPDLLLLELDVFLQLLLLLQLGFVHVASLKEVTGILLFVRVFLLQLL